MFARDRERERKKKRKRKRGRTRKSKLKSKMCLYLSIVILCVSEGVLQQTYEIVDHVILCVCEIGITCSMLHSEYVQERKRDWKGGGIGSIKNEGEVEEHKLGHLPQREPISGVVLSPLSSSSSSLSSANYFFLFIHASTFLLREAVTGTDCLTG